jgi:hypothetical protein
MCSFDQAESKINNKRNFKKKILNACSSVDVEKLLVSITLLSVVFKLYDLLFPCHLFYENMPLIKQMVLQQ